MLQQKITAIQCRDTALAFAFLTLLIWFFTEHVYWVYGTMGIVLFAMVWPKGMTWPARFWFGLSHVLGAFMSKVLLSLIYALILMPVALARRLAKKDAMGLRHYKAGTGSAFVEREHTFTKEDLQNPY